MKLRSVLGWVIAYFTAGPGMLMVVMALYMLFGRGSFAGFLRAGAVALVLLTVATYGISLTESFRKKTRKVQEKLEAKNAQNILERKALGLEPIKDQGKFEQKELSQKDPMVLRDWVGVFSVSLGFGFFLLVFAVEGLFWGILLGGVLFLLGLSIAGRVSPKLQKWVKSN